MEYKLTKVQEKLLDELNSKGFLTFEDFNAAYSTQSTRKACLERFLALGLVKKSERGFDKNE